MRLADIDGCACPQCGAPVNVLASAKPPRWRCVVCQTTGTAIDFLMMRDGVDYATARARVAN
jgi:hypothetical protein